MFLQKINDIVRIEKSRKMLFIANYLKKMVYKLIIMEYNGY